MPYAQTCTGTDRTIHDADSHIVETPDFLDPFLPSDVRLRMPKLGLSAVKPGEHTMIDKARRDHSDPAYRALDEE